MALSASSMIFPRCGCLADSERFPSEPAQASRRPGFEEVVPPASGSLPFGDPSLKLGDVFHCDVLTRLGHTQVAFS